MHILAIIPARGGSRGIPKKNIVPLLGKPLIVWSIEAALGSKHIDRVVVSSDDKQILETAKTYGSEVVVRPKKISGDNSPYELLIQHVLKELKKKNGYFPDLLVYLQPTSPLRTADDIDKALELFFVKKADAVISVYALDKKYLKSFIAGKNGFLVSAFNNRFSFANRQDLPDVFMPNGAIFAIKTDIFLKRKQLFALKTIPYIMSVERSIDIDTLDDLKRAEKNLKID